MARSVLILMKIESIGWLRVKASQPTPPPTVELSSIFITSEISLRGFYYSYPTPTCTRGAKHNHLTRQFRSLAFDVRAPMPTTTTVRSGGASVARGAEHQQELERPGRCHLGPRVSPSSRSLPELYTDLFVAGTSRVLS